ELRGDTEWRLDRFDDAQASWQKALDLPIDESVHRTLRAKLTLAADPRLRSPLGRFFFGDAKGHREPPLDLYFAQRATLVAPQTALPSYLLGRWLFLREGFAEAIDPLEKARQRGLGDTETEREAARILAIDYFRAGKLAQSAQVLDDLAARMDLP